MLSKTLIQFSVDEWGCVPSLLFTWAKLCWTLKDELPRSVCAPYATGDQWRNNSSKNEDMEPKQKQHPVVDVIGDGSEV